MVHISQYFSTESIKQHSTICLIHSCYYIHNTFCFQASTLSNGELLDDSHVWILPHYRNPYWWKNSNKYGIRCSNNVREILRSVLFVDLLKYNVLQDEDTEAYSLVSPPKWILISIVWHPITCTISTCIKNSFFPPLPRRKRLVHSLTS